jgi:hypothetical protein
MIDRVVDVFDEVLEYTQKLILIIKNSLEYLDKKCLLNAK